MSRIKNLLNKEEIERAIEIGKRTVSPETTYNKAVEDMCLAAEDMTYVITNNIESGLFYYIKEDLADEIVAAFDSIFEAEKEAVKKAAKKEAKRVAKAKKTAKKAARKVNAEKTRLVRAAKKEAEQTEKAMERAIAKEKAVKKEARKVTKTRKEKQKIVNNCLDKISILEKELNLNNKNYISLSLINEVDELVESEIYLAIKLNREENKNIEKEIKTLKKIAKEYEVHKIEKRKHFDSLYLKELQMLRRIQIKIEETKSQKKLQNIRDYLEYKISKYSSKYKNYSNCCELNWKIQKIVTPELLEALECPRRIKTSKKFLFIENNHIFYSNEPRERVCGQIESYRLLDIAEAGDDMSSILRPENKINKLRKVAEKYKITGYENMSEEALLQAIAKAKTKAKEQKLVDKAIKYKIAGYASMTTKELSKALEKHRKSIISANKIDAIVRNVSASRNIVEKINKELTNPIYKGNALLIEGIDVVVGNNKVEQQFLYRIETPIPICRYFNSDMKTKQYTAVSYGEYGNISNKMPVQTGMISINDEKAYEQNDQCLTYADAPNGYKWCDYRKVSEEVLLINFSGRNKKDVEYYTKYGIGFYVGKNNKGEKELFESYEEIMSAVQKGKTEVVGYYKASNDSTSSLKPGTVMYIKLDCTIEDVKDETAAYIDASRKIWDLINEEMGGSLGYVLDEFDKKRKSAKAGDEAIIPSDIGKEEARQGLICLTANSSLGKIKNIMVINTKLKPFDEFENEQHPELKAKLKDIIGDDNSDGGEIAIGCDILRDLIYAARGKKYTTEQLISLGLQVRSDILCLKGFGRVYTRDMMFYYIWNVLEDYAKDMILYFDNKNKEAQKRGLKSRYSGEELLSMLESPDKNEFENAKYLISNIHLSATKNEFKQINWNALNSGDFEVDFKLINAPNASLTGHSNQTANKVVTYDEEKAMLLYETLAAEKINDIANSKTTIRFNKDCSELANRPFDVIIAADDPDDPTRVAIKEDKGLMTNKLRTDLATYKAQIGTMRLKRDNPYTVACPNQVYLSKFINENGEKGFVEFLGRKIVDYVTPMEMEKSRTSGKDPKTMSVDMIEVYSPYANELIDSKIIALMKHGDYTKKQKQLIAECLRVTIMEKYPTQGPDEFCPAYIVSNTELLNRLKQYKKELTNAIESLKAKCIIEDFMMERLESRYLGQISELMKFYMYTPYSCTEIAIDNSLKQQNAGFDYDGDTIVKLLGLLSANEENSKVYYGLIYQGKYKKIITNTGELEIKPGMIIDDYVALLVEKYMIKNKQTGIVCCLQYPKKKRPVYETDKPVTKLNEVKIKGVSSGNSHISTLHKEYIRNKKTLFSGTFKANPKSFLSIDKLPNYGDILDRLGLHYASNCIGDEIGMTIVLCSVIIMASKKKIFENGKFNYDLVRDLFAPLFKGYKNNKQRKYTSVFKGVGEVNNIKDATKIYAINRLGFRRAYYIVNNTVIDKFIENVRMLSKKTTPEEWDALTFDFSLITRALGESSIDSKKDASKVFIKIAEEIINNAYRCLGNIKKPDDILDNLESAMNKGEKFKFDFDIAAMESGEERSKLSRFEKKYKVITDAIGRIKDIIRILSEEAMNEDLNDYRNSSYRWYKKYSKNIDENGNGLCSKYINTAQLIHTVIVYILRSNIPANRIYMDVLTKFDKDLLRIAIYNMALLEGCSPREVIKVAIEESFSKFVNGKIIHTFESDKYNAKLNVVMNFFGSLFTVERVNDNIIPVTLTLDAESFPVIDGETYRFKDGKCIDDDFIMIEESYTGEAYGFEGTLRVDYNPIAKMTAAVRKSNVYGFSIDEFAGKQGADYRSKDFFQTDNLDDIPYGEAVLRESGSVKIVAVNIDGERRLALERAGEVLAILHEIADSSDGTEKLVGATFYNFMLYGYRNVTFAEDAEASFNKSTGKHVKEDKIDEFYFTAGHVDFVK